MKKLSKKIIYYLIAVIAVVIVCIIGFIVFVHIFFFDYDEKKNFRIYSTDDEYNMSEIIKADGYTINYPKFHNVTALSGAEYEGQVYSVVNNEIKDYVTDVAKYFENYAKLDYSVDVDYFKTLTVSFIGNGYFWDNRQPVSLDKTFIFDISNVSAENPPVLVSETPDVNFEIATADFLYQTVYPDGTTFISTDGENWTCNGEQCEKPCVYFVLDEENTYLADEKAFVTAYNNGCPDVIGESSCGGQMYYLYENGWDYAPYKENVAWTSDFNSLDGSERFSAYLPDALEERPEGRYRYQSDFLVSHSRGEINYICSVEFNIKNK